MSGQNQNPSDEEMYGDVDRTPEGKPIRVTRYDGSEFEGEETDEDCPICNKGKLKIIQKTSSTLMLMCVRCGEEQRRPNAPV